MSIYSESAVEVFNSGFNCAQAVLASSCEALGLDKKTALRISGSFGAGMGYTGETCGAVTGAFMLIGLKYGKSEAEDNAAKEKTYALVKEFHKRFTAEFGSVKCKELLPYDISQVEELERAKEAGVFKTICPVLVRRSAEIIRDLLELDIPVSNN